MARLGLSSSCTEPLCQELGPRGVFCSRSWWHLWGWHGALHMSCPPRTVRDAIETCYCVLQVQRSRKPKEFGFRR